MITSFTVVGLVFSWATTMLGLSSTTLDTCAIILLLLFGLLMLVPALWDRLYARAHALLPARTKKPENTRDQRDLQGFVIGLSLGVLWTPCAGPILGSIFAVSLHKSEWLYSTLLFASYSAGASIPLLLIGYGSSTLAAKIKLLARHADTVKRISGAVLMLIALGLILDIDQHLQTFLVEHGPDFSWLEQRLSCAIQQCS
jgi:cytochrome c biogenesis protein CcdA